jgi:hypothetical protein
MYLKAEMKEVSSFSSSLRRYAWFFLNIRLISRSISSPFKQQKRFSWQLAA